MNNFASLLHFHEVLLQAVQLAKATAMVPAAYLTEMHLAVHKHHSLCSPPAANTGKQLEATMHMGLLRCDLSMTQQLITITSGVASKLPVACSESSTVILSSIICL